MTRPLAILFLALAVITAAPAGAQPQLIGSIEFEYGAATQSENAEMRERLMSRRTLEELVQFLSPLKLPQKLLIVTEECPQRSAENAFYSTTTSTITICYQYVSLFALCGGAGHVAGLHARGDFRRLVPEHGAA